MSDTTILHQYGLARYLNKIQSDLTDPDSMARVISAHGDLYNLISIHGPILAALSGGFRMGMQPEEFPVTGDWVEIQYTGDQGVSIIKRTLPRFSHMARKTPDRRFSRQILGANLDLLVILTAADEDFSPNRVMRFLLNAGEGDVPCVVLLSKLDLVPIETSESMLTELRNISGSSPVIGTSSMNGNGVEQLQSFLHPEMTTAFAGSSGVGKSTLINLLAGSEIVTVGDIREGDHKGRHTTTRRELLLMKDGVILMDMPGLREVGLVDVDATLASAESFLIIEDLTERCRFSDCTHTNEPGCAVLEAVQRGELDEKLLNSYLSFKKESAHFGKKEREQAKEKWHKEITKEIKRFKKYYDKRR